MSALISTYDLARKSGNPRLRIIDSSWHMPAERRDARAEYEATHIPGAVFFDIDANSDRHSPYPHMLPSPEPFAQAMGALGIGNESDIVVYDSSGIFSAPRLWWMLRVFGHDNVRVLDGGLPKWKAENRALESGNSTVSPTTFTANYREKLVRSLAQMRQNIPTQREQIADARSPDRFAGTEPEPRPGLASGHIPGSKNIHYRECLEPPFNTFKPPAELRELFLSRGVDMKKPVIATCGSGITACILALALHETGNQDVAVYDGSWAEWGSVTPELAQQG